MSNEALRRVQSAAARRAESLREQLADTNAWRLVNSTPDGFPGLTVDHLGPVLLIEQHDRNADPVPLTDALGTHFGRDTPIFLKERWSRRESFAAGRQVSGTASQPVVVVKELGLSYNIRLDRSAHIGLFLDARPARRLVREISGQKRVLNLFSYTGGFGVAAAAGQALSTTNVDNKRSALNLARQNYELNDLAFNTRTFVRSDAFAYLARALKGTGQYDLVILDPPPRSRHANGRWFAAHTGYPPLAARCLKLVAPGGYLLAGLNSTRVSDARFEELLGEAGALATRGVLLETRIGPGADFPPAPDRPHARFALCSVDPD